MKKLSETNLGFNVGVDPIEERVEIKTNVSQAEKDEINALFGEKVKIKDGGSNAKKQTGIQLRPLNFVLFT
ncbi:hypothetical protein GE107_24825 [Cohnella sp. CFH 77786]|uniref:hypothetical protein n=1 Tax=Cohnella sp. CFH 77786 TaxID=2662265 RepID=UPI001C60E97A|nr:hypothetical protein [Cohnella sp. CFH 77786]MBW5449253.1 hypothetical protein [Cohnella sp. CFH 77786]